MQKVKSPSEKLYNLRKEFKITLSELAGNKFTKKQIERIENNEIIFTRDIGDYLVRQINKLMQKRKVSLRINSKYFLYNKNEIINNVVKNLSNLILRSDDENYIMKLINTINSYSIEMNPKNRVIINLTIADKLYSIEKYMLARAYYIITLPELIVQGDVEEIGKVTLNLTRIHRYLDVYSPKDVLEFESQIFYYLNRFDIIKREIIYFNFAKIYRKFKDYSKALFYLEKMEEIVSPEFDIELQVEYGLILKETGETDKALEKLKKISRLKHCSMDDKIGAKLNILEILVEKQDESGARNCYSFLKKNIGNGDPFKRRRRYKKFADTAFKRRRVSDAKQFYLNVLHESDTKDNDYFDLDVKFESMERYLGFLTKKDLHEVKMVEDKFVSLVKHKKYLNVGYIILEFYRKNQFQSYYSRFLERLKSLEKL